MKESRWGFIITVQRERINDCSQTWGTLHEFRVRLNLMSTSSRNSLRSDLKAQKPHLTMKANYILQQDVFMKNKCPLIMASCKDGQDQKTNILKVVERSCHKKCSWVL